MGKNFEDSNIVILLIAMNNDDYGEEYIKFEDRAFSYLFNTRSGIYLQ